MTTTSFPPGFVGDLGDRADLVVEGKMEVCLVNTVLTEYQTEGAFWTLQSSSSSTRSRTPLAEPIEGVLKMFLVSWKTEMLSEISFT